MSTRKFRELILYLCLESEYDRHFGAVKLNKLLFFSDLEAYKRLGRTISGQEYQKLPQGPAPRRMKPMLDRMERDGEIIVREAVVWNYTQKRTFALREPDLGVFDAQELAIVDETLRRFRDSSGTDVSDLSHEFLGWRLADVGETIPFGTVFIEQRELTPEERTYALTLTPDLPDYAQ